MVTHHEKHPVHSFNASGHPWSPSVLFIFLFLRRGNGLREVWPTPPSCQPKPGTHSAITEPVPPGGAQPQPSPDSVVVRFELSLRGWKRRRQDTSGGIQYSQAWRWQACLLRRPRQRKGPSGGLGTSQAGCYQWSESGFLSWGFERSIDIGSGSWDLGGRLGRRWGLAGGAGGAGGVEEQQEPKERRRCSGQLAAD